MLEAPDPELYQNGCGVVNELKILCSHQCSGKCSMNKFRENIPRHVLRPSQESSEWLRLTSREQLISAECSKHKVFSLAKMPLVW